MTSEDSVTVAHITRQGGGNGTEYKFRARILQGGEEARYVIKWYKDTQTVRKGLSINDFADTRPIIQTLLRGNALVTFDSHIDAIAINRRLAAAEAARTASAGNGDTAQQQQAAYDNVLRANLSQHRQNGDVEAAVGRMMQDMLPHNALARIERNVRREARKPAGMKVRYQHLVRVNYEEIPCIPPFDPQQVFTTDELLDILLFGPPKTWQREMERQGFCISNGLLKSG